MSTDQQAEDGAGLDIQHDAIRRWAETHGHVIVGVHRDEGISGTKDAADRPGLAAALAALADGIAGGLIVWKLDRLARTLTVQEAVLAQAWRHGGSVYTVDLGEIARDDPDDPMRTAMRQMVGVFAQLDRGMTVYRLTQGRRHKRSKGGWAAFGSPAYGQRSEGRELVPDEDEQAAIARMLVLRGEGRSLRHIVATLTLEGHRPKRADRWHVEVVRRTLARLDQAA